MEKFKYLGVTVTNTNDIREEIKRRINMENACYYSLEKMLSFRLLTKKLKVKKYETIKLPKESSRQKKISDDGINGLYEDTKRKAEKRVEWENAEFAVKDLPLGRSI